MPARNTFHQSLPLTDVNPEVVVPLLKEVLHQLEGVRLSEIITDPKESIIRFSVEADNNTWSRGARRKRKRLDATSSEPEPPVRDNQGPASLGPALACTVSIILCPTVPEVHLAKHPAPALGVLDEPEVNLHAGFGFGMKATAGLGDQNGTNRYTLEIQWVYGKDRAIFESFASHVGRKFSSLTKGTS